MVWEWILSFLGLGVLLWRTQPWRKADCSKEDSIENIKVSIIVPCRNEEAHIDTLVPSLLSLKGLTPEILIVDDGSTDATASRARNYGVHVIRIQDKPQGWVGKSWACWQGAKVAQGDYFLFTDADTLHSSDSIFRALKFLKNQNADLLSAPPYHLCRQLFEKGLGLFHLLPFIATAFNQSQNPKRVYAIGQYLLISKQAYFEIGGHERIRSSLAEDIDLAKTVLEDGYRYAVFPEATLYQVQMYNTPGEFLSGWRRLLRLGMKRVSLISFLEITLVFHLFFHFSVLTFAAIAALYWIQKKHGNFHFVGALLAPLSLLTFALLSLGAVYENLRKKGIQWRERTYVEA